MTEHDIINKLAVVGYHLKEAHRLAVQLGVNVDAVDIKEHVFTAYTEVDQICNKLQPDLVRKK